MSDAAPRISKIPYHRDSARLFSIIARLPWAVFLDSGYPRIRQGRYDILAAEPRSTLVTRGARTEVRSGGHLSLSPEDPFELVRAELGGPSRYACPLPFCGGAIGYFSYDLARRIEDLPHLAATRLDLPEMAVGIYDWSIVVDHDEQRSWLVSSGDAARSEQHERLLTRLADPPALQPQPYRILGPITHNMTREEYAARFRRILDYIDAGDCYQVNFAQGFSVPVAGDPWDIFCALREINPAPFSAYLNTPDARVLSLSPERFLQVHDELVETRPIKGTRPRGTHPMLDQALAAELIDSQKDRAENLMIVDLLRNDLGKSCATGSIEVPRLFELQSFSNVHHLVSTVLGRLPPERSVLDLLKGCFPGGSITGAPKLRAMEIIEELEPERRGVYCGSIGYIGYDGNMDTNIAIRTVVHRDDTLNFFAGGGIVADSREREEYRECFAKVSTFLDLFASRAVDHVGS